MAILTDPKGGAPLTIEAAKVSMCRVSVSAESQWRSEEGQGEYV